MSAADSRIAEEFPPWPNARVDLASYTAIPGAVASEERLLGKIRTAGELVYQVIICLTTDACGDAREPATSNEREALELLHRIHRELLT